ncbi:Alginate lyase [Fodinibius roseus]|uniref:Alginate lyase n=1 Tax=Fodinibius roseus TaxID=1194090 RepID=A0A1M4SEI7_9BACT|nr:alginate lyase family protein [Fodinibius roseus]SHE30572.1 Alginate lyase [Fodinibius roseus]
MKGQFILIRLFVSLLIVAACSNQREKEPDLLLANSQQENHLRKNYGQKITGMAEEALQEGPFSVMDKNFTPPSGDKHDYMSIGIYWWPNPDREDGLPWIRKDGQVNPQVREITDATYYNKTRNNGLVLGLAYHITGEEQYAAKAAELLKTWFLRDSTKMNPNLNFGQGVPGRTEGRRYGIIETRENAYIFDAIRLIQNSQFWNEENTKAMQAWFGQYLDWLLTSTLGQLEGETTNNHGIWYDFQVASIALALGDTVQVEKQLTRAKERIKEHIEADGSQPRELARTKSYSYSTMNLQGMMALAMIGEKIGMDLWNYQDEEGAGIQTALDFLLPAALQEQEWQHEQIEPIGESMDKLTKLLLVANYKYPDSNYGKTAKKIRELYELDHELLLGLYQF